MAVSKKREPDLKAKAGESISERAIKKLKLVWPRVFERWTAEDFIVKPKGTSQDGQWICADCGEIFQNNMMAWSHSDSHRRVWWTGTDFEEP